MNQKQLETWAPWGLLIATLVIWQAACSLFHVSEFVFPSPLRIWEQMVEYRDVIAGHAWRTFWVTMVGFGIAIVVGVLLGFVIGSSRLAYAAVYPLMTAFNALPKAAFVPILVVWFGIGLGPGILTAFMTGAGAQAAAAQSDDERIAAVRDQFESRGRAPPKRVEYRSRHKDGREIDMSVTVSPIKGPGGRILGASKIARDITERKRLEQERLQLNPKAFQPIRHAVRGVDGDISGRAGEEVAVGESEAAGVEAQGFFRHAAIPRGK